MRRNHENTNEIVKYNHSDLQMVKENIKALHDKIDDISYHVKRATFQELMNDVDISEFFPIESSKQLEDFMNREHADWPARKREFYNYLYNGLIDDKKAFTKGLLKLLFSREFMFTIKWPTFG